MEFDAEPVGSGRRVAAGLEKALTALGLKLNTADKMEQYREKEKEGTRQNGEKGEERHSKNERGRREAENG